MKSIQVPSPTITTTHIDILEGISWHSEPFADYKEVATALQSKQPYTVTILIEHLKPALRAKKEYVKYIKQPRLSKYKEAINASFNNNYGDKADSVYSGWLQKYRPLFTERDLFANPDVLDNHILKHELEPRYRQSVLAAAKDHKELFRERHWARRDRYYKLPEPLQYIDWRTPYDNLFIWHESGQRLAERGGNGSSTRRKINSKFIFGLLELNRTQPVPSFLFIYTSTNTLTFVKKFDSLCVPFYDIGLNYRIDEEERKSLLGTGQFIRYEDWTQVREITVNDGGEVVL